MASILRRIVVAALLAVWSFPASAAPAPSQPAPIVEKAQSARTVDTRTDVAQYAEREQQAPANQNFQGGGVSIYIGGGVLTAALIILLIILIL